MEELRATFRPEFLNRVDETIVFRRLSREDMLRITRNLLAELQGRFAALGLGLEITEEAVQLLAQQGYDESYGARPLRRTVQTVLEDAAAELLLDGRVQQGETVEAQVRDGQVVLVVKKG